MKTFKQILKEAGSDNWSISAADLAKKAHDPQFVQQLKSGGRANIDQVMKQVAPYISPDTLLVMSPEDIEILKQRLMQHIDTVEFKAQQKKKRVQDQPATNAKGVPPANDGGTKIQK